MFLLPRELKGMTIFSLQLDLELLTRQQVDSLFRLFPVKSVSLVHTFLPPHSFVQYTSLLLSLLTIVCNARMVYCPR